MHTYLHFFTYILVCYSLHDLALITGQPHLRYQHHSHYADKVASEEDSGSCQI